MDVAVSVTGTSGQAAPTGTVTVTAGSYSGEQTLAGAQLTFTVPAGSLSAGSETVTAAYSGDPVYAATSKTASVTVSEVVVSGSAPTAVSPGASANSNITVSAGSTYSGTMNLTCTLTASPSGAQSLPTCSLNPASVSVTAGKSGTSTLTVQTTAAGTTAQLFLLRGVGGSGALAAMLLLGIPARRRRWITGFALLALVMAMGAIGCGGGGGGGGMTTPPPVAATTAGNYTFTVTGTDSTTASTTASATVTVTVQ